jgi:ferritin-like metal-binding protein YciE
VGAGGIPTDNLAGTCCQASSIHCDNMEQYEDEPALDAGLLAAAQAVEHYEISRYGTLRSWATKLGRLLDQTLAEEKKTDDALTKLADSEVNEIAEAA